MNKIGKAPPSDEPSPGMKKMEENITTKKKIIYRKGKIVAIAKRILVDFFILAFYYASIKPEA
jgi:hypothetical protein